MRRNEEHWKCPFFIHCWEEGLTLPSADNCPQCNGFYRDSRSYKRSQFDDGPHRLRSGGRHPHEERIPMHDQLGGRVSAHDWLETRIPAHERLGGRTMLCDPRGGRIPAQNRLEQMADDRMPDDQPMRRDPEREPFHHRTKAASLVSCGFDQVTKEACSTATPAGDFRIRRRTNLQ